MLFEEQSLHRVGEPGLKLVDGPASIDDEAQVGAGDQCPKDVGDGLLVVAQRRLRGEVGDIPGQADASTSSQSTTSQQRRPPAGSLEVAARARHSWFLGG